VNVSPATADCARRSSIVYLVAAAGIGTAAGIARAQEGHEPGTGAVTLAFMTQEIIGFDDGGKVVDYGKADINVLDLEIQYALSERWMVHGGILYSLARYRGDYPHDSRILDPPNDDAPFIDDGKWNGDFGDARLGFSYLWRTDPLVVRPFVTVSGPSNDYAFFGDTAAGQHLWHLELGTAVEWHPPFDNYFLSSSLSYTFVEETLGEDVSFWKLGVELGYYLSPAWSVGALFLIKEGDGVGNEETFFASYTDDWYYHHDQTIKHEYSNAGLRLNWAMSETTVYSLLWMRQIYGDMVQVPDYVWGLNVTRSF
jgi:hypothetical protein